MKTKIVFLAVSVLVLVLSACGSAPPIAATNVPPATSAVLPVTGSTPAAGQSSGTTAVNVGQNSSLGSILVDPKGMTLYIFTKDTMNTSNCNASCLATWPALLTTGSPKAGTGVNASMLGTIKRSDGGTQVTYNGHPLYTFVGDKAAGDATGQGMFTFWFVIAPTGNPVTSSAPAAAGSSSNPTPAGSSSSGSGSGSGGGYPGYGSPQ